MAYLTDEELAQCDPETIDAPVYYPETMDAPVYYLKKDTEPEYYAEEDPEDNTFLMGLLKRDCEELLDAVENITRISGNIKFYNITRQRIQEMAMLLRKM